MKKLKLRLYWCAKEKDFMVDYPSKSDGGWIFNQILGKHTINLPKETGQNLKLKELAECKHNQFLAVFEMADFIEELERRGYDKTTLKFEVQIDINKILDHFPHVLSEMNEKEQAQFKTLQEKAKSNTKRR